jgi:hypothetical protein
MRAAVINGLPVGRVAIEKRTGPTRTKRHQPRKENRPTRNKGATSRKFCCLGPATTRPTADIGCHTFRLTGITAYLANGGALEHTHKIGSKVENAIRASLASGKGLLKTTRELKVGSGTVERIRWAMAKQG